jgi:hypothetical protein
MGNRWKVVNCAAAVLAAGAILAAHTVPAHAQSGASAAGQALKAGGVAVEAGSITATVTAIDTAKRKLTLTTTDGRQTTYKAPKDMTGFEKLNVGDTVKASVYEEVAIALTQGGMKLGSSESGAVALAPSNGAAGSTSAMMMADTMTVTAQVDKVHKDLRRVTLKFSDGKKKWYHVDKSIDLAKVKEGEDVTIRVTEAIALSVVKA